MLKDYYTILEVPSNATLTEIKQAYRRLAMRYHPDKNANDPYIEAQFTEIKEAYEVLTSPARKERYLQQRWYYQSIGKKRSTGVITPVSILKLTLELEQYVSKLDVDRMNKEGLSDYILELLSADTIEKLKHFNEAGVIRQIITTLLYAIKPLPLKFLRTIVKKLEILAGDDNELLQKIKKFLSARQKSFLWSKYKVVVMLLFTVLICLLIYLTGKT